MLLMMLLLHHHHPHLMSYLFEDEGENMRGDSQEKMCVAAHANDWMSSPGPQACKCEHQ